MMRFLLFVLCAISYQLAVAETASDLSPKTQSQELQQNIPTLGVYDDLLKGNSIRVDARLDRSMAPQQFAGTVSFSQNVMAIPEEADGTLDEIAQKLKADRHLDVELIGHSSLSGSREYAIARSDKRLAVVEAELIRRGVRKNQIRKTLMGDTNTESPCSASECMQAALRVDLYLVN